MRRLITALILMLFAIPASAALSADGAKALFERIQTMAGDWVGKSTKGWVETDHIQVIAGGSAVVITSFDAHPKEHMVTMIHLDGERLLLTHYCMAGNQPRLVATSFDAATGTARFEFLDGTNMPSRDKGHMDSVLMRLIDQDHRTERWTWYEKGHERWLEDVDLTRTTAKQ
jgi:hypothetical protein